MKYNARKTVIDGITFDSKREANRYAELKLLLKAGEISDLKMQVPFVLQDGFTKNGKRYRPITYIADFVYTDNRTGRLVIEDTKGYRTAVYKLKKKLFEKAYEESITEI